MRKDEVIAFATYLTHGDKRKIEPIYDKWEKSYTPVKEKIMEPWKIERVIFRYFNIRQIGTVYSKNRSPEIIYIRQLIQYFLSELTKLDDTEIGALTGGFDRTTIPNSVKAIKNYYDTDRYKRAEINDIERKLKS